MRTIIPEPSRFCYWFYSKTWCLFLFWLEHRSVLWIIAEPKRQAKHTTWIYLVIVGCPLGLINVCWISRTHIPGWRDTGHRLACVGFCFTLHRWYQELGFLEIQSCVTFRNSPGLNCSPNLTVKIQILLLHVIAWLTITLTEQHWRGKRCNAINVFVHSTSFVCSFTLVLPFRDHCVRTLVTGLNTNRYRYLQKLCGM